MSSVDKPVPLRVLGRYAMYDRFAAGGMATVHFGRLLGPAGFSRTVAIKQLHGHFASDPDFVSMFVDEARLAARIRHPNVVQTLDVVASEGELFVVLDYVHGESLSRLVRVAKEEGGRAGASIVSAILFDALQGLHAAHEARDAGGDPLDIVHRDVSPHNILVGADGVARVIDFGIAKARGRAQTTREGQLKGKLAYMSPEQIRGTATRRSDVFAASIVLWECLAGRRLFEGADEGQIIGKLLMEDIVSPRQYCPEIPAQLEDVVMRGLRRDPNQRFASAREMAVALEASVALATPIDVGSWVERLAHASLKERATYLGAIETSSSQTLDAPQKPAIGAPRPPMPSLTRGTGTAPVPGLAQPVGQRSTPPRGRAGRFVLPVGVLLAAMVGVATMWHRRPATAAAPATSVDEPEAASAPDPPTVAGDPDAPPASAMAVEPSAPPAPKPPAPAPTHPGTRPRATSDRARAGCSPPYLVDPMGLRHYKPECLK